MDPVELRLTLLTGETVPLHGNEFLRIARHRYLAGFYLCIFAFIFVSNLRGGLDGVTMVLNSAIHLASVAAGVSCLLAAHAVATAVARRRGRVPVLHLPFVLTLVITAAMVTGDGLETLLLDKPVGTPLAVLARWGFYVIAVQVGTALAMYLLIPRILAELRGQPIAGLKVLDMALQPPLPATVTLGGQAVVVDDLLHLHADGNRVLAATRTGRLVLPGPLADLVAALPDGAGLAVHRSDWVAARAVARYRREGRSVTLVLTDGSEVRAAQTRLAQTMAWLESLAAVAEDARRVGADLP